MRKATPKHAVLPTYISSSQLTLDCFQTPFINISYMISDLLYYDYLQCSTYSHKVNAALDDVYREKILKN